LRKHCKALDEARKQASTATERVKQLELTLHQAETEFNSMLAVHCNGTVKSSFNASELRVVITEHCMQNTRAESSTESVDQLKAAISTSEAILVRIEDDKTHLKVRCDALMTALTSRERAQEGCRSELIIGDRVHAEKKRQFSALDKEEGSTRRDAADLERALSSSRQAEGVEAKLQKCRQVVHSLQQQPVTDGVAACTGRSQGQEVIGMLIDCIAVQAEQHMHPLLAVLGVSFASTIAVVSRGAAIRVAEACRRNGLYDVVIDIANESDYGSGVFQPSSKAPAIHCAGLVDLSECMVYANESVRAIMTQKLKHWVLFTGQSDGCDGMSQELSSALQYLHRGTIDNASSGDRGGFRSHNLVTLSGTKFFRDGAIRSTGQLDSSGRSGADHSHAIGRHAGGGRTGTGGDCSEGGGGGGGGRRNGRGNRDGGRLGRSESVEGGGRGRGRERGQGLFGREGGVGKYVKVGADAFSCVQVLLGSEGAKTNREGSSGVSMGNIDLQSSLTTLRTRLKEVMDSKASLANDLDHWEHSLSVALRTRIKSFSDELKATKRELKCLQQEKIEATSRMDKERNSIIRSLQTNRELLRELIEEGTASIREETARIASLERVFGKRGCAQVLDLQRRIIEVTLLVATVTSELRYRI
jgi:hypothetical protein